MVQIRNLLTLRFGTDSRIEVEPGAKLLSPVKNPAGAPVKAHRPSL